MFAVDDVLISDALLDAPFACNLDRCLGGCCVQGDSGAPLEAGERERLERLLPVVRKQLRPEALKVIEREGVWEETGEGQFATTCVSGRECVFVVYEGPVAKCALQRAFDEGRTDWPKPISCHLFPIRVSRYGEQEVLNYEQVSICAPACKRGRRKEIQLIDFLRSPLVRKYGAAWYDRFRAACVERRSLMRR